MKTVDDWADWIAGRGDPAELEEALRSAPALVSARTDLGDTLLHEACWHKRLPLAALLVSAGADVNARGDLGRTPLHCAVHDTAAAEALPLVRLLVEHHALPEREDALGFTVAEYARRELWDDPSELLAVLGAAPGAQEEKIDTFEATVARMNAIEAEAHTALALFQLLEAFGEGRRFEPSTALPRADVACLKDAQQILEAIAGTSWAGAARQLLRRYVKPGHVHRLLAPYFEAKKAGRGG